MRSGTAVLERGAGVLQIGGDPDRHVILKGVTAAQHRWLTETARRALPREPGDPDSRPTTELPLPPGGTRIQSRLATAGFLEDSLSDEHSRFPSVRIDGVDPVSLTACELLGRVGVRRFDAVDSRSVGRSLAFPGYEDTYAGSRTTLAAAVISRSTPRARVGMLTDPDVVIVSRPRTPSVVAAGLLMSEDRTHLLVTRFEHSVIVGPFVRPGLTPCGQCLSLALTDCDPVWPFLAKEMPPWPLPDPTPALVHSAALVIARAVVWSSGLTDFGRSELVTPGQLYARIGEDGRIAHDQLRPHARCGCGACGTPFQAPERSTLT